MISWCVTRGYLSRWCVICWHRPTKDSLLFSWHPASFTHSTWLFCLYILYKTQFGSHKTVVPKHFLANLHLAKRSHTRQSDCLTQWCWSNCRCLAVGACRYPFCQRTNLPCHPPTPRGASIVEELLLLYLPTLCHIIHFVSKRQSNFSQSRIWFHHLFFPLWPFKQTRMLSIPSLVKDIKRRLC